MISLDYNLVLDCNLSLCCSLCLDCYTGTRFQEQARQEEVLRNHSILGGFHVGLLSPLPNGVFWRLVVPFAGTRLVGSEYADF